MQRYYLVDGTTSEFTRWSPVSPVVTKDSPESEHLLQQHWAARFWVTSFVGVIEYFVGGYEEHYSLLTEHLPYQDGVLISLLDRARNKRTSYRPAKAAKILFPGRSALFYKEFAESIIKPTASSLELTDDFRSAYMAVKSCMSRTETTLRAVELYKSIPGVSCLIIKSDKGATIGRALCSPSTMEYGKLYLHPLLDESDVIHLLDGWRFNNNFLVGEKLPLVRTDGGILCPYLDTDDGEVKIMEDYLLITDYGGVATTAEGLIVV